MISLLINKSKFNNHSNGARTNYYSARLPYNLYRTQATQHLTWLKLVWVPLVLLTKQARYFEPRYVFKLSSNNYLLRLFITPTWKRIVRRASGAVQVLLTAPATPPARSCETVPICDCWCCNDLFCCATTTTPPWVELRAISPTLASVCIYSLFSSLSLSFCICACCGRRRNSRDETAT